MYAVFGLGNPDKEYDKTRHNIGFDVIDELASHMGVEVKTKRHKALCGIGNIGGEKVILVKPQTYMNLNDTIFRSLFQLTKRIMFVFNPFKKKLTLRKLTLSEGFFFF